MSIAREILTYPCLYALIVCGVVLFALKVLVPAWTQVRKFFSLTRIEQVVVGLCVVGPIQYGSTKQGWHISWDGGIKDLGHSLVANDAIHIEWQRDTSHGVYIPDTAAVYIDYRPNTATNEEYGLLAQSTVGAWQWNGTLANATNYDYSVWAYYIPPEPVHTNGVWVYKTLRDRNGKYAIPLRARIQVNGVAIATPAEKRKDLMNHIWKIEPYFYGMKVADTYPDDAKWYYENAVGGYGSCSAVVDAGILYRNYDWNLDFTAEFLVVTEAAEGRFKSMGIGSVGDKLTDEFVQTGEDSRYYRCVAGHMLDGVNEKCVVAEINVVNGTPSWGESGDIHPLAAVRWVLDNAVDAAMAASNLASRIKFPEGWRQNFHYIVADTNFTYIVENGEYHKTNGRTVMTNFRLYPSRDTDGEGQERYDSLVSGATIESQRWTKAYLSSTRPIRFSDLRTSYESIWYLWAQGTKDDHRSEKVWWQTLHTARYDIMSKTLTVSVQEGETEHTFKLDEE